MGGWTSAWSGLWRKSNGGNDSAVAKAVDGSKDDVAATLLLWFVHSFDFAFFFDSVNESVCFSFSISEFPPSYANE